ncbi:hypothetical protein [Sphingobium nicotianae]|uniref:DUF2946 domain-containing protein n=1 Tax=Sphingobium nicotianae TaxID=2782607 RepID=A0A9X1IRX5_9SPHN|nr:hypothetical protein [Sphingobium nicotianae]MBT2187827.1 hypothetical protein [Sphingobium nicotianae]
MYRLIRQSDLARGFLAVAMVLALLMRIAVPAGFMPTSIDGKLVVQLCTGTGPATMTLDIGKDAPAPDKHKMADSPCAFSGGFAGGLIDAVAPVVLAPALALLQLVNGAAIADLTVHRLAAPPPPAIGPPLPA